MDGVERDLERLAGTADADQQDQEYQQRPPPWRPVEGTEEAKALAGVLVEQVYGALSWGLAATTGCEVHYPDELRRKTGEQLAAVLTKYDGQPPPWLRAYWEELVLATVVGQALVTTVFQVRAQRAERAEGGEGGSESESQPA